MTRWTAILTCVFGVLVAGQRAPNAPAIVSATVIADALPVGMRVSAIAVEYSDGLRSTTIPASAFDYRLFTPVAARGGRTSRTFPLVFALHGMGSSGTDNIRQVVGESITCRRMRPTGRPSTPCSRSPTTASRR